MSLSPQKSTPTHSGCFPAPQPLPGNPPIPCHMYRGVAWSVLSLTLRDPPWSTVLVAGSSPLLSPSRLETVCAPQHGLSPGVLCTVAQCSWGQCALSLICCTLTSKRTSWPCGSAAPPTPVHLHVDSFLEICDDLEKPTDEPHGLEL